MNIKLVELLIEILYSSVKNLTIYYVGKNKGKEEEKKKFLKKQNDKLKEINKLNNNKMEVSNEINSMDSDSIYSEWLR